MPKDWGTTGIIYRGNKVKEPMTSWKDFFDLAKGKYSGKIFVVDSPGDVFVAPLRLHGFDVNTTDKDELETARQELMALRPHLQSIDSDNYPTTLQKEEAVLGLAWNGTAYVLQSDPSGKYKDTGWTIPTEGTIYWTDTWVLLADAPNPNAAYAFLDWIQDPKQQVDREPVRGLRELQRRGEGPAAAGLREQPRRLRPDESSGCSRSRPTRAATSSGPTSGPSSSRADAGHRRRTRVAVTEPRAGRRRAAGSGSSRACCSCPAGLWYLVLLVAAARDRRRLQLRRPRHRRRLHAGVRPRQLRPAVRAGRPVHPSLEIAVSGTTLCLLVGFPLAYFLATRAGRRKTLLLVLLVIPFWTSFLVRTIAWLIILGPDGLDGFLTASPGQDVAILGSPWAVLLGIVYNYLPLMVFPLYVTLERLDPTLLEASKDLGAGRWATFRQITLPISRAGPHHRQHPRVHPADGRVRDPVDPRARQDLPHRQRAPARLPGLAQLAGGLREGGGPDRDHAGQRHVLRVDHHPRPRRPGRERPVSASPVTARADALRPSTAFAPLVEAGSGSRPRSSTCSCSCRSSSSSCSASTPRPATSPTGRASASTGTSRRSRTSVQKALRNSLTIAFINALLATPFGTMAALGLQRVRRRLRIVFDALTFVSVIIPEIVIALATLVLFPLFQDWANPWLAFLAGRRKAPKIGLGPWSVVAAHVLFNLSLVLLLVRARLAGMDRTLVDASYDLYATPWRTFRQITFPQLLPAIVAGFLLSFTFSFDDYVISSFVSGSTETLPLFVFGQIHQGITPLDNAIAAVMLLVTLTILLVGQARSTRQSRAARRARSTPLGMLEG